MIGHKASQSFHAYTDSLKSRINGKKELEDLKLQLAKAGNFKTFLRLLAISGMLYHSRTAVLVGCLLLDNSSLFPLCPSFQVSNPYSCDTSRASQLLF